MDTSGFALFETAIGACTVIWRDGALIGALLPERTPAHMRARIGARYPQAAETEPPPAIAAVIEGVIALLAGEGRDLRDVVVDLTALPDFEAEVLNACRRIPPGQLMTYGELAARLGAPEAARAVGVALGHNPIPIVVPCHRVVGAGGKLVGFSAPGGVQTKRRILEIEGARLGREPDLFD